MKLNLYINPIKNNKSSYVWVGEAICFICKEKINNLLFILFYRTLFKEHTQYNLYCPNCSNKITHTYRLSQLIYGRVDNKLRKNYIPVLEMPFSLGNNANISYQFDAVNVSSEQTINKTKYALKTNSLEGSQIGKIDNKKLNYLDKSLELEEVEKELNEIINSEVIE